jgi:hypothetical protein
LEKIDFRMGMLLNELWESVQEARAVVGENGTTKP